MSSLCMLAEWNLFANHTFWTLPGDCCRQVYVEVLSNVLFPRFQTGVFGCSLQMCLPSRLPDMKSLLSQSPSHPSAPGNPPSLGEETLCTQVTLIPSKLLVQWKLARKNPQRLDRPLERQHLAIVLERRRSVKAFHHARQK